MLAASNSSTLGPAARRPTGSRSQALGRLALRPRGSGWLRRLGARGAAALSLFTLLAVFARDAWGAFDANDTTWEGGSELFEIAKQRLGRERIELSPTLDYGALTAKDGLLVLHPEVTLDYEELSAFLRAGGRLAVLDDHGTADRFLSHFQIQRVQAPGSPAKMLRDNPELPIAEPAVQVVAGQEQNRHPITQGVDFVVTNHPTALTHPNLTPVLTISARGEPDATLAVTGIIVNRGRLFAMGDPSALINVMLRYPGNRKFADGLLAYLVENDTWGDRGGKVYIVSNRFQQKGEFGGRSGLLRGLGQSAAEALAAAHDRGLPFPAPLLLAALASLGVMAWGLANAARPKSRVVPRYAAQEAALSQGGIAGRAAVLGAKSTSIALSLAELRSAVLDFLGDRLGLGRAPSADHVLGEVARRELLPLEARSRFARALADLALAEAATISHKPFVLKAARASRLRKIVMAAAREIDERSGAS